MSVKRELNAAERKLLARTDLALSRESFERCCAYSRQHSKLAETALITFGDHGSNISGIVRDHFPIEVKNELRHLCASMNLEHDIAMDYKPRGVFSRTIAKLGRAVAARDGSGFYGPQG